ncbi:MAG TPA: alpha-1,2-fucosyltransferase [Verrucomicrobiae bacterium]
MIVTRLEGGLGNQLFQYALGRKLSLHHGVELRLDCECYRRDSARKFVLDQFPIQATQATLSDIWRACPSEAASRVVVRLRPSRLAHSVAARLHSPYRLGEFHPVEAMPPLMHGKVVRERHYHFDKEVLRSPNGSALIGFWHSERYFQDVRPQLLAELRVPPGDSAMARRIAECESVSLHVRRTDMVKDPRYTATTAQYCHRAMEVFRAKLERPQFFVFSDDAGWAYENLVTSPDVHMVSEEKGGDAVEEFRLMSHCRHHVLAASTFSWWAAWLNDRPEKVVVAPPASVWLKQPNCDARDLLPPEWEQIPVE